MKTKQKTKAVRRPNNQPREKARNCAEFSPPGMNVRRRADAAFAKGLARK